MNWSRVASYHNYISTLICHTTAVCCHGNMIVQALCSRLAHLVSIPGIQIYLMNAADLPSSVNCIKSIASFWGLPMYVFCSSACFYTVSNQKLDGQNTIGARLLYMHSFFLRLSISAPIGLKSQWMVNFNTGRKFDVMCVCVCKQPLLYTHAVQTFQNNQITFWTSLEKSLMCKTLIVFFHSFFRTKQNTYH